LFKNIVNCAHIYKNSYILITIFFIALFEFIVDIPAFKKKGLSKDVKATATLSIGLVTLTIAILILFKVF